MHFNEPLLQYAMYGLLAAVVSVAGVIDLRTRRIPNILTFPAMAAFVLLHWIMGGTQGLIFSLAGLFAGLSVLIAAYVMKFMGAGDVKLMAAVGACLGVPALLTVFLLTSIAGGVHFSLILLIRRFRATLAPPPGSSDKAPKEHAALRMCYGLSIAVGTLATMAMRLLDMQYIKF
jgi:prepilin peptidase CpaA